MANFNESGIRRVFSQMQTASSWKELVRHARSLISLLRRERIALNYGLLAQDLLALRSTRSHANAVRARWGGISKAVTDANRLTIVLENRLKSSDYSDHLVEFETSEPNISYCVIPYF